MHIVNTWAPRVKYIASEVLLLFSIKTNSHYLALALFMVLGVCQPALATKTKYGPFKDLKSDFDVLDNETVPTSGTKQIPPQDAKEGEQCFTCIIKDKAKITTKKIDGNPTYVNTYFEVEIINNTINLSSIGTLTDLWAFDLQPALDPETIPLQTGFDPLDPSLIVHEESFIGFSGTVYTASLVTSTLANLPTLLPGYDLPRFTGNPDSIVYVAQANVPVSDFISTNPCPVPAPLPFLGVGAAFGFSRKLRKRIKGSKKPEVISAIG